MFFQHCVSVKSSGHGQARTLSEPRALLGAFLSSFLCVFRRIGRVFGSAAKACSIPMLQSSAGVSSRNGWRPRAWTPGRLRRSTAVRKRRHARRAASPRPITCVRCRSTTACHGARSARHALSRLAPWQIAIYRQPIGRRISSATTGCATPSRENRLTGFSRFPAQSSSSSSSSSPA